MGWQNWVVVVAIALAVCGFIGVKLYDNYKWKQQMEATRREFEQMKTRYADTQHWIEKRLFELDRKMDKCTEDIEEVNGFARGLETELYDTYDTLEAMINGSEDTGEE